MSTTLEIKFAAGGDDVDRAMSALKDCAWCFEHFDRSPRSNLLVLVPERDLVRAREDVERRLAEAAIRIGAVRSRPMPARLWVRWSERARLVQVGPVWIAQGGARTPIAADRTLTIDSRAAFGSGLHPTTMMSLDRILALSPAGHILDVGTGSGILSLAGLALGAQGAVGVEIDPLAAKSARDNATGNRLGERFVVREGSVGDISEGFELVVANIVAPILFELAPMIASRVAPGGQLVLTGMRHGHVVPMQEMFRALGFNAVGRDELDGWVRLDLARPS